MSIPASRAELWMERGFFALGCVLLAWALLEHFVPPHPIEGSGVSLLLAVALFSATGAPLVRSITARRVATAVAYMLLVVVFWMI